MAQIEAVLSRFAGAHRCGPGEEGFSLWVSTRAQDLIALYFPFDLVHTRISSPRGGPVTKQSCLKMELLSSGPPGPEKNISAQN